MRRKKISLIKQTVPLAYEYGYRVNQWGDVISPFGKTLKIFVQDLKGRRGNHWRRFCVYNRELKKPIAIPVHRLAAYQRFGAASVKEDIFVYHKNFDSKDDRPSNIDIGTKEEVQQKQARLLSAVKG